jgi:hypothetical protein
MLGGMYQSVLRNELTHRFGVDWAPIVKGQAEIVGVPDELRDVFSKRGKQVDEALKVKADEFRQREGPSTVAVRASRPWAGGAGRHPWPQVRARCRRSGDTVADRGGRRRLDRRPSRCRSRTRRS